MSVLFGASEYVIGRRDMTTNSDKINIDIIQKNFNPRYFLTGMIFV